MVWYSREHPTHSEASRACCPARRGYTLIEVLTIITVLGIVLGLVAPMIGNLDNLRLREAARLLAADIAFAQVESIAHPDDPRVVVIERAGGSTYWITPASNTSKAGAITDELTGDPYVVRFGTGRGGAAGDVVFESYSLGGDNELGFDAFGVPDQSTSATITLTLNGRSIQIQVAPQTGDVTIVTTP